MALSFLRNDMNIKFTDNSKEVLAAMQKAAVRALEKCGLTGEGYAKKNLTKNKSVDTGNLRNSITHEVNESEQAAYIGTDVEYASYVEMGTIKQKAKPYLKPAVADHAQTYRKIIEGEMKNG